MPFIAPFVFLVIGFTVSHPHTCRLSDCSNLDAEWLSIPLVGDTRPLKDGVRQHQYDHRVRASTRIPVPTVELTLISSQVTIAYCTVLMVPTVVLSVLVSLEVYKHWKETVAKMIRLAVFMFFSLIAVMFVVFFYPVYWYSSNPSINVVVASGANFGTVYGLPNILVSLTPVSYVLVFATQRDIISAWMFCRRRNRAQPVEKSPTIDIV